MGGREEAGSQVGAIYVLSSPIEVLRVPVLCRWLTDALVSAHSAPPTEDPEPIPVSVPALAPAPIPMPVLSTSNYAQPIQLQAAVGTPGPASPPRVIQQLPASQPSTPWQPRSKVGQRAAQQKATASPMPPAAPANTPVGPLRGAAVLPSPWKEHDETRYAPELTSADADWEDSPPQPPPQARKYAKELGSIMTGDDWEDGVPVGPSSTPTRSMPQAPKATPVKTKTPRKSTAGEAGAASPATRSKTRTGAAARLPAS